MPQGDILGSAFSSFGTEKVDKEIEILQTFHINNLALKKINFHTRYYIDAGFKQVELYGNNVPIEIKDVTIINKIVQGHKVKLIPEKDGYRIQVRNSFKTKILNMLI